MDAQLDLLPPPPKCRVSLRGIEFDPDLGFEEWAAFGKKLNLLNESLQWIIGDWLNWGHQKFERTKYLVALEALPYQYQTLANLAWVAGRIEFSARAEKLTFRHHVEAAALEPAKRDRYLRVAEQQDWSVADLRQAIRQDQAVFKRDARPAPEKDSYTLATQLHLWLVAQDFETWSDERRQLWKHELKPIVEVYAKL